MKNVLITGSSGFVGSNLIAAFRNKDIVIGGIDRKTPLYIKPDHFFHGDILDQSFMKKVIEEFRPDIIVHLAALATIQKGLSNPELTHKVNVTGTRILLDIISELPNEPILIYASTDKVYGENIFGKYTETMPLAPISTSPYDCSKAVADQMVREWVLEEDHKGLVVRFCNLYGPMENTDSPRLVPATISCILDKKIPVLNFYLDEKHDAKFFQRDLLYVGDLCEGLVSLVAYAEENEPWGEAFNFGSGSCYGIDAVIRTIYQHFGKEKEFVVRLRQVGDTEIRRQYMDYTKAKKTFGFEPVTDLEQGIRQTIKWWKKEQERMIYE